MGSGLSAKRKKIVCKEAGIDSESNVKDKIAVCKTQSSDGDSSDCDEDTQEVEPVQHEPDYEQRRAIKLRSLIEENLELGHPMSSKEAIQFLIGAERASRAYGYQRHIDECKANLDIYPREDDFNRKEH